MNTRTRVLILFVVFMTWPYSTVIPLNNFFVVSTLLVNIQILLNSHQCEEPKFQDRIALSVLELCPFFTQEISIVFVTGLLLKFV